METKDADCDHTPERLAAWLSGQLPEAERADMATHLTHCAACRQEEASLRQLWQRMGHLTVPEPGEQVRPRFYAMLAQFEAEAQRETTAAKFRRLWQQLIAPSPALRLAYSVLLLVMGLAMGYGLSNRRSSAAPQDPAGQLATVSASDKEQQMVLTMLENPSATQRLRAVGQTKEIAQANQEVVNALLSTLNNDPNVNVRLATLDALAQLGHDPVVRQGLVRSLTLQESPLVQLALADVMVQLQVRRSVQPLQQLLKQSGLNQAVKTKIESSIQTLSNGRRTGPSSPPAHENPHAPLADPGDTVAI
jgi:hypothetical protein